MNEMEWLAGDDPFSMLNYLGTNVSDRKLRLFACACARRCWSLFRYPGQRNAIELAERFAEGKATEEEREQMWQQGEMWAWNAPMFEQAAYQAATGTLVEAASLAALQVCELVRRQATIEAAYEATPGQDESRISAAASARESLALGRLVQEVFGNPFRPVTIEPAWLKGSDGAVAAMARWIEEEWRVEELPYLADALTDAGCTAQSLLRHLRGDDGGHVRGCWALDTLLGR